MFDMNIWGSHMPPLSKSVNLSPALGYQAPASLETACGGLLFVNHFEIF